MMGMGRYPEVEAVINDCSGLDVQSIGRTAFERATELRLRQAPHESYVGYVSRLISEEDELASLLDLLLVPETWFFRDAGAFAFLAALVRTGRPAKAEHGVLHILSAPCSTGEEPYSIAITMLAAGLKPSQIRIDASDISSKALAAAKTARYTQSSFRGPLTAAQTRFFERGQEFFTVSESVRSLVSFSQGNLVDPSFMDGSEKKLDIIFCKNLMIYLGQAGRTKVMATLDRLLKDDGLLFVGHSEVALFHKAGYTPVASAKAFALTKERPETPSAKPRHRTRPVLVRARRRPTTPNQVANREDAAKSPSAVPLLDRAWSLADRGDLEEAARLCRSLLQSNSMDVGTYYLAGLIEQSRNRLPEAEEFFLKAIYLDPDHYETLVQLCLLSEKKGDAVKAGQYRRRLRRLEGARAGNERSFRPQGGRVAESREEE